MLLIPQGFKSIAVAYCFFLTVLFYTTDLYGPRIFQKSYETAGIVPLDTAIGAAVQVLLVLRTVRLVPGDYPISDPTKAGLIRFSTWFGSPCGCLSI